MDLNKKNMKSWMLLIVFAVLVYGVVQRIEILAAGFAFLYSIIMPFVLGAAMAFILNIPMHFLEKRLFRKAKKRKFVRPVCLVLSIFFSIEQPGPDCFIKTVSESVNYILADFIAVLTDGWTDGRNDVFRP